MNEEKQQPEQTPPADQLVAETSVAEETVAQATEASAETAPADSVEASASTEAETAETAQPEETAQAEESEAVSASAPAESEPAPAPKKRDLPPPPKVTGLIGRKLGMTHIFDEQGRMVPVTVIELGPCYVVQVRTPERDGYHAVQLGFGPMKTQRANKPYRGIFKKADLDRPLAHLKEFRVLEGEAVSGQEVRAEHVFEAGEIVKVTGTSKGKGFAGTVKRWGHAGGPKTHGSMTHRRRLSSGATGPQRVFKGLHMAGRMGGERVTTRGLTIVAVQSEANRVLIRGAVPGGRGSIVYVQKQ